MRPLGTAFQHSRSGIRLAVLASALLMPACNHTPTSSTPVQPASVASVAVTCPAQLLVGQSLTCTATANFVGGGSTPIYDEGVWSSSDSNIASAAVFGLIKGRSAGLVAISTLFRGVQGSAQVNVSLQDALQCGNSLTIQGDFKVGATVTMMLSGFYGIESAGSGELGQNVVDQNGATVATTAPRVVSRGGDSFVLSTTFTIPAGATQVCPIATLQIGATGLSSVPPSEALRCRAITQ